MPSFFDNGPLPDWKEIKRWLGKDMPWKQLKEWEQGGDEWLDKFISRLLKEGSEAPARGSAPPPVQIDAVQNDKKLTVSVRIPPGTEMRNLRLFATSDRLRVAGLPGQRSQHLRFPCRVYPKSGRAVQKGSRIVVHFQRRPDSREEVELFIRP